MQKGDCSLPGKAGQKSATARRLSGRLPHDIRPVFQKVDDRQWAICNGRQMQKKAGFQFDDTLLEALGEEKGPNITFVGMERNFFLLEFGKTDRGFGRQRVIPQRLAKIAKKRPVFECNRFRTLQGPILPPK